MTTPPPGWGQQPPPQQPPPGYGYPPQQQPPPGYGPPGYGYPPQGPPKKNSKAPLVIVLVIGLLALGGVSTAVYFYLNAHRDRGTAATGDKLPGKCGGVSGQTLARLRTTNPNGQLSNETDSDVYSFTACSWQQTKGVDGEGSRSLSARIEELKGGHGKSAEEQTKDQYDVFESEVKAGEQISRGPLTIESLNGLGDQALIAVQLSDSAFTEATVVVRKGEHALIVEYSGWDIGTFSPTKPDPAEFKAAVRAAAEELLSKL
jgi:hypothetical protein